MLSEAEDGLAAPVVFAKDIEEAAALKDRIGRPGSRLTLFSQVADLFPLSAEGKERGYGIGQLESIEGCCVGIEGRVHCQKDYP